MDWTKMLTASETYGVVKIDRKNMSGKVTTKQVYNPALYDALKAEKRNKRQKRVVSKVMNAI